jgi:hypothetical protein
MRWQMPNRVSARIFSEFNGVPTELSAELFFDRGASAGLYCSFVTNNQEWALISGSKGYLRIEDFVLPFAGNELQFEVQRAEYRVSGCDARMVPEPTRYSVTEPSHGEPGAQECNLFRSFSDQIRSRSLNSEWPAMALQTQSVMGACLDSARGEGKLVIL